MHKISKGGLPPSFFQPFTIWLTSPTARLQLFNEILCLDMPGDDNEDPPKLKEWLSKLVAVLGTDPQLLHRTLLIGHSCGAQACFRVLQYLPHHVAGVVAVAPWLEIDRPWPAVMPWLADFPSYERIHAKCRRILCLVSDNDPFTKNYEKTGKDLEDKTGALVIVVPGRKHFTGVEEEEVFKRVLAMARIILDPMQTSSSSSSSSSSEASKSGSMPRSVASSSHGSVASSEEPEHPAFGRFASMAKKLFGS